MTTPDLLTSKASSTFPNPHSPIRNPKRAFSLVEVTLALGIMAFAFTAVFGMLPMGLQTFRDSADKTRSVQIAQRLVADVQQTPFDNLPNLYNTVRYYDIDGEELAASAISDPTDYSYSAQVVPVSSSVSTVNSGGVGISSARTRMVLVKIAKNRDVSALTASQKPLAQYVYAIADVRL